MRHTERPKGVEPVGRTKCGILDLCKPPSFARSVAFPKEGKGDHVVVDEAAPYGFSVATERGNNHQVLREAVLTHTYYFFVHTHEKVNCVL